MSSPVATEAEDGARPRGSRSRLLVGASIVVLVFGAVVARWLLTPFDDWVPLTPPTELPADVSPDDLPQAAEYRCSAVFGASASAEATPQATQALEVQQLTREPCVEPRAQNRAMGVVDLVVSAVLLVVLLTVHRRWNGAGARRSAAR